MNTLADTAMVLAAGLGTRLRPLTLHKPKPMLEVGGRTMLDHALDKLVAAGIKRAVVNVFHLGDQIKAHLASRHDIDIIISQETELLDTGGGIKHALNHFGGRPFFALNADLPWIDGSLPSLKRMQQVWNGDEMDGLLLLMPTGAARGFSSSGDFALDENNRAWRKDLPAPRPFVWISAQILKPEYFIAVNECVFSNNKIWNEMELRRKLFGIVHSGTCYHVGTPEDLAEANRLLTAGVGWSVDA